MPAVRWATKSSRSEPLRPPAPMIGSVSPFLLSQILAAGAFVLGLGAFQFAAKRSVFLAMAASALLKSLHFFLLACPEAGVLMLVVASRFTAGIFTVSRLAMYFYIAVRDRKSTRLNSSHW